MTTKSILPIVLLLLGGGGFFGGQSASFIFSHAQQHHQQEEQHEYNDADAVKHSLLLSSAAADGGDGDFFQHPNNKNDNRDLKITGDDDPSNPNSNNPCANEVEPGEKSINFNKLSNQDFSFEFYLFFPDAGTINSDDVTALETLIPEGYNDELCCHDAPKFRCLETSQVLRQRTVGFSIGGNGRRRLGSTTETKVGVNGGCNCNCCDDPSCNAVNCRRRLWWEGFPFSSSSFELIHNDYEQDDYYNIDNNNNDNVRKRRTRRLNGGTAQDLLNALIPLIQTRTNIPNAANAQFSFDPLTCPPDSCCGLGDGDVVVVGINGNESGDQSSVAIVPLVDLPPGATFYFTDERWRGRNDGFDDLQNEGTIKVTTSEVVNAGTVLVYSPAGTPTTGVSFTTVGTDDFEPGTGGDSVILYCSPSGDNTDIQGLTFLFGVNYFNSGWGAGGPPKKASDEPDNVYTLELAMSGNTDSNFKYNGVTSGTRDEILFDVVNKDKWLRANSDSPFVLGDISDFMVTL